MSRPLGYRSPGQVLHAATSWPLLTARDARLVQRVAAGTGLVGAGLIHGAVAGEHLGEWQLAGLFFLTLELVQVVLALLCVVAWGRSVAAAVVVVNGAALAVWLLSRSVGMPFGPADFRVPEPAGVPDVACGVLELVSLAASAWALRTPKATRAPRRSSIERGTPGPGAAGAAVVAAAALVVTVLGVAPVVHPTSGGGHQHGASPAAR